MKNTTGHENYPAEMRLLDEAAEAAIAETSRSVLQLLPSFSRTKRSVRNWIVGGLPEVPGNFCMVTASIRDYDPAGPEPFSCDLNGGSPCADRTARGDPPGGRSLP